MKKEIAYVWLLALAGLLVLSILLALVFLGSHDYYQDQHYNNLPSINQPIEAKPAPIEHYEQMRDESVRDTEEVNKASASGNISINLLSTTNIFREEGGLNIYYLIILSINFTVLMWMKPLRGPIPYSIRPFVYFALAFVLTNFFFSLTSLSYVTTTNQSIMVP